MKRFVQGENRNQSTLFPETLEEYVTDENPVRVIEAFIEELDFVLLGFHGIEPKATGRPAYHPSTLLKIYVYGYLNRIHSSRRLERETQRNVELMWLTGRLMPDFKTIADFRKDNGEAIKNVCKEFVLICRRLNLLSEALVAIDGSKFKAINSYDNNFSRTKIQSRLDQLEASLERYFKELESADRLESSLSDPKKQHLEDKIKLLKKEVRHIQQIETQMLETSEKQISLTDPDSRSMRTKSKSSGIVAYNVQTAVEGQNHLIVAHEVTNVGNDRSQLSNMAEQARAAMGIQDLTVLADRGYYKGQEILACEESGITTYVPKSQTSGNQAKGFFGKSDFIYKPKDDEYECPAGERLIYRFSREESSKIIRRYWTSACTKCPLKMQCTTGQYRRVSRWEHEAVLEVVEARLIREPERMGKRRSTVEHPFGTIKCWMGSTHFLTKRLNKVSTEMSLHVLAYNMKRVMNILGIRSLIEAM